MTCRTQSINLHPFTMTIHTAQFLKQTYFPHKHLYARVVYCGLFVFINIAEDKAEVIKQSYRLKKTYVRCAGQQKHQSLHKMHTGKN